MGLSEAREQANHAACGAGSPQAAFGHRRRFFSVNPAAGNRRNARFISSKLLFLQTQPVWIRFRALASAPTVAVAGASCGPCWGSDPPGPRHP